MLDQVVPDRVEAAKIPVDWGCPDLPVVKVPRVDQLIHRAVNSLVTRSSTSDRSTTPLMVNIRQFICQVSTRETIVVPCPVRYEGPLWTVQQVNNNRAGVQCITSRKRVR